MYEILRIVLPIICIVGIIYLLLMKNKYKNDTSSSKEDIIKIIILQIWKMKLNTILWL